MFTQQDRIQIIEQKLTEKLQTVESVPEDLANKYSLWLQGKVAEASQQLASAETPPAEGEQEAAS